MNNKDQVLRKYPHVVRQYVYFIQALASGEEVRLLGLLATGLLSHSYNIKNYGLLYDIILVSLKF